MSKSFGSIRPTPTPTPSNGSYREPQEDHDHFWVIPVVLIGAFLIIIFLCHLQEIKNRNSPIVSTQELGIVLDVSVIPVAFNSSDKTQVKTEKMSVVIVGLPAIPIGAKARLEINEAGWQWFTCDGCARKWGVL